MGFLFSALMLVDFLAVDLMLGRPAPNSPVCTRPGSAAVPPGQLPWCTPGVCAGASCVVSGFPTFMFDTYCLLCSWPSIAAAAHARAGRGARRGCAGASSVVSGPPPFMFATYRLLCSWPSIAAVARARLGAVAQLLEE